MAISIPMPPESKIQSSGNFWNHRTTVVRHLIQLDEAESYLEIGYGDGANFAAIRCARKWSVDPAEGEYASAAPTHRMTSDTFFALIKERFDVIFIDGLHHADQVERDIRNALAVLNVGGAVVCHDLNPTTERMQEVPRAQNEWTGDCWKAWVKLRGERSDLAMLVVDADYGVGIILPGAEPWHRLEPVLEEDLTWENFSRHRREWLNLMPPRAARATVMERLGREGPAQLVPRTVRREALRKDGPTALILYGVVHRCLRHVIGPLRENLIAPLTRLGEVDVFFHSWDVSEISNPRSGEDSVAVDCAEVARWLPEAQGIFESQDKFDSSIDWEPMFGKNPMRYHTRGEEAGRITLMNLRRALESQERAWRFFQQTKTRDYARVVVTRPDLLFLEEPDLSALQGEGAIEPDILEVALQEGTIWVPRFHPWGGVNDRFAMGSEEAVGVWCQRAAFFDGWMLNAGQGDSEWLLMKWLERNRIEIRYLDFVFQRMRANGKVDPVDRNLKAVKVDVLEDREPLLQREGCVAAVTGERFLILARRAGEATERLARNLSGLGKVEVIVDQPGGDGIWYPDQDLEGFSGLMGRSAELPATTAWTRAMFHVSKTLEPGEAIWFVEDDVAGDRWLFEELVEKTVIAGVGFAAMDAQSKERDPDWYFWGRAEPCFTDPWRAFQPLCRVHGGVLQAALEFQRANGKLLFHEILFASLASQMGVGILDWRAAPRFQHLIGEFRYRPEVERARIGICHPVKDAELHGAICRSPAKPTETGSAWYGADFNRWRKWFRTEEPVKALEIGAGSGISSILLLQVLFPHAGSEVHCVEDYERAGEEARSAFLKNAAAAGTESRLHLYEGTSAEILAWMVAGEGYWESFDFIHLVYSGNAAELLSSACQSWQLLKPGGVLAVSGTSSNWQVKSALKSFAAAFSKGLRNDSTTTGSRYFQKLSEILASADEKNV